MRRRWSSPSVYKILYPTIITGYNHCSDLSSQSAPWGLYEIHPVMKSGSCYIQARIISDFKVRVGFTSDPTKDHVKNLPFSGLGWSFLKLLFDFLNKITSGRSRWEWLDIRRLVILTNFGITTTLTLPTISFIFLFRFYALFCLFLVTFGVLAKNHT